MNNGIHAYVYNSRRHPVGVLAAVPSQDKPSEVVIGWSRCNNSAGDRFDKHIGVQIAYERSLKQSTAEVPMTMEAEYTEFYARATRYFKDRAVVI
jgi:hypothetical protein